MTIETKTFKKSYDPGNNPLSFYTVFSRIEVKYMREKYGLHLQDNISNSMESRTPDKLFYHHESGTSVRVITTRGPGDRIHITGIPNAIDTTVASILDLAGDNKIILESVGEEKK